MYDFYQVIQTIRKKKIPIMGFSLLVLVIVFIITLPQIIPPVFRAEYEYKLKGIPALDDVNTWNIVNSVNTDCTLKRDILDIYNRTGYRLSDATLRGYASLAADKTGKITITVKHKDASVADSIAAKLLIAADRATYHAMQREFLINVGILKDKIALSCHVKDWKKAKNIARNDIEGRLKSKDLNCLLNSLEYFLTNEKDSLLVQFAPIVNLTDSSATAEYRTIPYNFDGSPQYLQNLYTSPGAHIQKIPNRIAICLYACALALILSSLFYIIKDCLKNNRLNHR